LPTAPHDPFVDVYFAHSATARWGSGDPPAASRAKTGQRLQPHRTTPAQEVSRIYSYRARVVQMVQLVSGTGARAVPRGRMQRPRPNADPAPT
jgi:hypothetical protein